MALRAFAYENFLAVVKDHMATLVSSDLKSKAMVCQYNWNSSEKVYPCSSVPFHFLLQQFREVQSTFSPQGHSREQRAAPYKKIMVPKAQQRKTMGYLQYTG